MKKTVEQFEGLRVLLIGDVMIDAYCFGKVDRISPEAPVPVVAVEKEEMRLGGAANVAMNLASLGAKTIVCSVIGKDKAGENLISLFKSSRIGVEGIVQSEKRKTTIKTRVISQQTQMLRIDSEMTTPVTREESAEMVQKVMALLPDTDVLIFQDYDKGVLTRENIEEITAAANSRQIPVVVDPKKRNFNSYKNVTLFKPNLKELKDGLNRELDPSNKADFESVITSKMKESGILNMMITMSENGVMITDGKTFDYIPAHFRKIADVSGAGDTVISIAALCVALGADNHTIATFSNLGGGLVCEEVGVVPVDRLKLKQEIEELGL